MPTEQQGHPQAAWHVSAELPDQSNTEWTPGTASARGQGRCSVEGSGKRRSQAVWRGSGMLSPHEEEGTRWERRKILRTHFTMKHKSQ